ncbi:hypothetical protein HK098_006873 [Nowakowskiella sp. JEL0407]|nr:hypothetical protein HK098_006873 [Nowakowskiella sp. JEL0407]
MALKLFVKIVGVDSPANSPLKTVLSLDDDATVADLANAALSYLINSAKQNSEINHSDGPSRWHVSSTKLCGFDIPSSELTRDVLTDFITPNSSLDEKTWSVTVTPFHRTVSSTRNARLTSPILKFSPEILMAVSSYLSEEEQVQFSSTCKSFRPALFNHFWKDVKLRLCYRETPKFIDAMKSPSSLYAFRTFNHSMEINCYQPMQIFPDEELELPVDPPEVRKRGITVVECLGENLETFKVEALGNVCANDISEFYPLLGLKLRESGKTLKSLTVQVQTRPEVCHFLTATLPYLENLEELYIDEIDVLQSRIQIPNLPRLKKVELDIYFENQTEELVQLTTRDLARCRALEELLVSGMRNYPGEIVELLSQVKLKILRFDSVEYSGQFMKNVADGIAQSSSIEVLDFGTGANLDSRTGFQRVLETLLRSGRPMKEFTFPGHFLEREVIAAFKNFLAGNIKIERLDISSTCDRRDDEVTHITLAGAFEGLALNKSVEELVCREMYFPNEVVDTLIKMVKENTYCTELDLAGCVFERRKQDLVTALFLNSTLNVLDLSDVDLNGFGHQITEFMKNNLTLEEIRLNRCGFTKEDCNLMILGLFQNRNLHNKRVLEMRFNGLTAIGITGMLEKLMREPKKLTFSVREIDEEDLFVCGTDGNVQLEFVSDCHEECYDELLQEYMRQCQ